MPKFPKKPAKGFPPGKKSKGSKPAKPAKPAEPEAEPWTCGYCDIEVEADAKRCPSCGAGKAEAIAAGEGFASSSAASSDSSGIEFADSSAPSNGSSSADSSGGSSAAESSGAASSDAAASSASEPEPAASDSDSASAEEEPPPRPSTARRPALPPPPPPAAKIPSSKGRVAIEAPLGMGGGPTASGRRRGSAGPGGGRPGMATSHKIILFGLTPGALILLIIAIVWSMNPPPPQEDPNRMLQDVDRLCGEANQLYQRWRRLQTDAEAPPGDVEAARRSALQKLEEAWTLLNRVWEQYSVADPQDPGNRTAKPGYEYLEARMREVAELRGYIFHDSPI